MSPDYAQDQLIGYTIIDGTVLSFLPTGPFRTGNEPSAVIVDPRGLFIYVTNSLDSTVSPYEITLATGTPTGAVNATGSGSNSTDTQPVAIVIDPALGRFVYTANFLGNSISGFRADPTSGALTATQATVPYRGKTDRDSVRSPRQLFHAIGYTVTAANSAGKKAQP